MVECITVVECRFVVVQQLSIDFPLEKKRNKFRSFIGMNTHTKVQLPNE